MINNVDLDGNTVLDFKEFSMMMTNQTVRLSFGLKSQHAYLMNIIYFRVIPIVTQSSDKFLPFLIEMEMVKLASI